MGTKQNVIEINGKKYNAVTGKILQSGAKPNVKSVDGFTKRAPMNNSTRKTAPARSTAAHNKKSAQKSQTLMRAAVKKPVASKKTKPTRVAGISKPTMKTNHTRRKVASATPKHANVSRYGDVQSRSSVVKKVQHMPVKQPKQHA